MLARANLALGLLSDQNDALGQRCNPWALAGRHGSGRRESLAGFFIDLLAAGALEPKARQQIEKAATNQSSSDRCRRPRSGAADPDFARVSARVTDLGLERTLP